MNVQQAYQTLGIPEGSDKDVVKKAFRKLAAKYHPDVNKEQGAEDEFKKVNQAWQTIENPPPEPSIGSGWHQGGGFNINLNDIFNGFASSNAPARKKIVAQDITLQQTLSFREVVLGCTRDITYLHNTKCPTCNGEGQKVIDNGCEVCRGAGKIRSQRGNTIVEQPCHKCRGKISHEPCSNCSSNGYVHGQTVLSVNIPPGAVEGSVLNLGARGNYFGTLFGMDQNSHLSLHIRAVPQVGLSLRNNDVICTVPISLLEALEGVKKMVPTIDGEKEIDIPKLTKNKEEISLPNLGVGRKANQIAIIQVSYPNDIDKLLQALKDDQ